VKYTVITLDVPLPTLTNNKKKVMTAFIFLKASTKIPVEKMTCRIDKFAT